MFQLPAGFDVCETAMSRWFTVVNAPLVGFVSSVSTTTKKRCVAASYRHDGSVTNWPRTPVVRLIAGGCAARRQAPIDDVAAIGIRRVLVFLLTRELLPGTAVPRRELTGLRTA